MRRLPRPPRRLCMVITLSSSTTSRPLMETSMRFMPSCVAAPARAPDGSSTITSVPPCVLMVMLPFKTLQLITRGCEVLRAGTTTRSPAVSCAPATAQRASRRPVEARVAFISVSFLSSPLSCFRMQADGAVQSAEGKRRAAFAGADFHVAAGAVDESCAAAITLDDRGHRGHVEIRINAAVQGLEGDVGIERRLEVNVERPVQGVEGRLGRGVAGERDLDRAVQALDRTRPRDFL